MIRFDAVSLHALRALDFQVPVGACALIVAPDDERRRDLFTLLGGLTAPERGRVLLFGESLYDLPDAARTALYRRVGAVPVGAGLISNLKTWENILLPAAYHGGRTADGAEAEVLRLFREFGVADPDVATYMGMLPDGLPAAVRRYVALIRALLTDAELMIYDDVFTNLGRGAAERVADVTRTHHAARAGRTSVFLAGTDEYAGRLRPDLTLTVE
jgi:predicted ABC-type transport system involved in lysophospholipase L1 biosynthesis ATPase subunit